MDLRRAGWGWGIGIIQGNYSWQIIREIHRTANQRRRCDPCVAGRSGFVPSVVGTRAGVPYPDGLYGLYGVGGVGVGLPIRCLTKREEQLSTGG